MKYFNNLKAQIASFIIHTLTVWLMIIATKLVSEIPKYKGKTIFVPPLMVVIDHPDLAEELEIIFDYHNLIAKRGINYPYPPKQLKI